MLKVSFHSSNNCSSAYLHVIDVQVLLDDGAGLLFKLFLRQTGLGGVEGAVVLIPSTDLSVRLLVELLASLSVGLLV